VHGDGSYVTAQLQSKQRCCPKMKSARSRTAPLLTPIIWLSGARIALVWHDPEREAVEGYEMAPERQPAVAGVASSEPLSRCDRPTLSAN
jgi:hypothetical protein